MKIFICLSTIALTVLLFVSGCMRTVADRTDNSNANALPPKQETESDAPRIKPADAKAEVEAGHALIVDTRAAEQYNQEHIQGAINVPINEFENRIKELPTDKKIIAYCS